MDKYGHSKNEICLAGLVIIAKQISLQDRPDPSNHFSRIQATKNPDELTSGFVPQTGIEPVLTFR